MLRRLSLNSFRNIEAAELDLGSKDVFFEGQNGQGKTNLLEAVYLSCYAASFRPCLDADLIRMGQEAAGLEAVFESSYGQAETIRIKIEKNKKSVSVDGKALRDRRELVELHPCVVFSHDDMEFASGSPERRRWFFDQTISLSSPLYIDTLRDYKKILKSRNRCLRDRMLDILDSLDEQLINKGWELMEAREKAVAAFSTLFSDNYAYVSQLGFPVELSYRPSWKAKERGAALDELNKRRSVDLENCLTLSGPHRDRFSFQANKQSFSHIASTGQLRLLSLVLRSCQARFFSDCTGKKPILLLDDILLELDPTRRQRFMETIPEYEQAFSAFLPGEPYELYRKAQTMVYHVDAGSYRLLS